MKTLYLIHGIPSSGKSTLARTIYDCFAEFGAKHFEADQYFIKKNGEYEYDKAKIAEAHKWCINSTRLAMERGIGVIVVSNTFTEDWQLAPYRNNAPDYGYTVCEILMLNNYGAVHGPILEKTIEKMRHSLAGAAYTKLLGK
jgi:predicted kinase